MNVKQGAVSWGRYPVSEQSIIDIPSRYAAYTNGSQLLPYGLGRSYGDVCQNDGRTLVRTCQLNHLISFDMVRGVIRAEAGVSLSDLLQVIVRRGWFLPVTPGTQFVTLGGAVANDVHGKNHHGAGTFGCHVLAFELLRTNGERIICTPTQNRALFCATVGGLGLTGLITWVELQLIPISNPLIDMESIKFGSLAEFFTISRESDATSVYTVAWLDCVSGGSRFGRGIFMRGNHAIGSTGGGYQRKIQKAVSRLASQSWLSVPFELPVKVLNSFTVRAFNELYYHKQFRKCVSSTVSYEPFFYPLDAVLCWNRIYGKPGFLQFQCVIPRADSQPVITELLSMVVKSQKASFLAVLKEFGNKPSPGMLSFPMEGATLCLDFPFEGQSTLELFSALEEVVIAAKGRLYPAKDACMKPSNFRASFPNWESFSSLIDPGSSSSFWRRVMS